jgi:hypothetical protein
LRAICSNARIVDVRRFPGVFAIGEVRAGLVERVASDATNHRRDDLSFGSPLDRSGRCNGAGGIVVCVHMETHADD